MANFLMVKLMMCGFITEFYQPMKLNNYSILNINIEEYRKNNMSNKLKKLANLITDVRIIGWAIITVVGVAIWIAISWTSLLERVGAVEEVQGERIETNKSISSRLGELKIQQAVMGEQITGIEKKTDETNALVRELLKFLRK